MTKHESGFKVVRSHPTMESSYHVDTNPDPPQTLVFLTHVHHGSHLLRFGKKKNVWEKCTAIACGKITKNRQKASPNPLTRLHRPRNTVEHFQTDNLNAKTHITL